ncbi:MAG: hypothetical protein KF906_03400 [Actinobacteria bacterium]|nr:hypothetical protein [Actinomycetota bacterium]
MLPLPLEIVDGVTMWHLLSSTGNRLLVLAVAASLLALAAALLVRPRSAPVAVVALSLLVPGMVWSSGSTGGTEELAALGLARFVGSLEPASWAYRSFAYGWVVVLVILLVGSSAVIIGDLRSRAGTERVSVGGDAVAAAVGLTCVVVAWFTSLSVIEDTFGIADREVGPALLEWRFLSGAPAIDQVLRIACPVVTVLLVASSGLIAPEDRARRWIGAATASIGLFVVRATLGFTSEGMSGQYEVRPTVSGLLLALGAALGFAVAAWIARVEVVQTGGAGPSDPQGTSLPRP